MRALGILGLISLAVFLMGTISVRDEGVKLNPPNVEVNTINCSGAGITCTYTQGVATFSVSGGGAGAPSNATYITQVADATLTNEQALGALGNGIMVNTTGTGVVSIYAGSSCGANQYANATSASGALTCAQVTTAQLSGTITDGQLANNYSGVGACGANQWASTLNDNAAPTCTQPGFGNLSGSATDGQIPNNITIDLATAASALNADPTDCGANQYATTIAANGNLTCAQVTTAQLSGTITDAQLANNYSGVGTCTNQFVRNVNDNAAPTCATVALATDTSGTLAIGRGGTGQTTITTNQVYVGTALDTLAAKTLPSCSVAGTSKLLYNNTTQEFTCGTDQTGGGGGNWGNFAVSFGTGAISQYESDQVVVAAAWVTGTSEILVRPKCYVPVGANTVENCLVLQIECQVIAVSAGVSFTAQCMTPYTGSGSYTISYTGA